MQLHTDANRQKSGTQTNTDMIMSYVVLLPVMEHAKIKKDMVMTSQSSYSSQNIKDEGKSKISCFFKSF